MLNPRETPLRRQRKDPDLNAGEKCPRNTSAKAEKSERLEEIIALVEKHLCVGREKYPPEEGLRAIRETPLRRQRKASPHHGSGNCNGNTSA